MKKGRIPRKVSGTDFLDTVKSITGCDDTQARKVLKLYKKMPHIGTVSETEYNIIAVYMERDGLMHTICFGE
jgi:ACT domain-containing protein